MKRFFVILVTIIFSVCTACGDAPNAPIDLNSQQYYFEIEYVNHAWGYMHYGYSIESSGNVYKYTITTGEYTEYSWTPDLEGDYTFVELTEKFSRSRAFIANINETELKEYIDFIEAASRGRYSDPSRKMFDAGALKFKCYTYDRETDVYHEILLHQELDTFIINTSPEAIAITMWLKMLKEQAESAGTGSY